MNSFVFMYYPKIITVFLLFSFASLYGFVYYWEAELKKIDKGLSTDEIFNKAGGR